MALRPEPFSEQGCSWSLPCERGFCILAPANQLAETLLERDARPETEVPCGFLDGGATTLDIGNSARLAIFRPQRRTGQLQEQCAQFVQTSLDASANVEHFVVSIALGRENVSSSNVAHENEIHGLRAITENHR